MRFSAFEPRSNGQQRSANGQELKGPKKISVVAALIIAEDDRGDGRAQREVALTGCVIA